MRSLLRMRRLLTPYIKNITIGLIALAGAVMADLAVPRLTQTVIDQGVMRGDMPAIVNTSLLMVGITALSAVFAVINTTLSVRVSRYAAADLRSELFSHIQSLSFANLDHLPTGQLMTRLSSDVMQITMMIQLTLRMFIRAPLMISGSLVLLFITNWQMALIMLILMPATIGLFWAYAVRAQPLFMRVQRRFDRLNNALQETLSGARLVKAFVRQDYENERFSGVNTDLMNETVRVGYLLAMLLPAMRLIINLATLAVIWLGGLQAIRGALTVGEIVAFNNYLMSVLFPLTFLGMMVNMVAAGDASAERVLEVLETTPEIREAPDAQPLPRLQGCVAFEDVSFAYNGNSREPVLENINFTAAPGQTIAILGATGAGKSTLVNLIPRFYDPYQGRVTIDGIDVRTATLESLRTQVSVVLQESVLFAGTIRDNIRYGRPDATDEEVVEAAIAAQAHSFITSFPDGYDSMVGQRGVNLSGGQKQRIAIARALVVNPGVLILDDSTSSVDLQTEMRLQQALGELMKGRTSFIIAQRVSSVLGADCIIVLDRGRIAASGSHAELMANSPIYREIYDSQLGNGEESIHAA